MIADSHCHLDFSNLYNQLDDVVKRAENNNVKHLLAICTTLESFEKIKIIINKYKNIYGTLGIHPHETEKYTNVDSKFISKLKKNKQTGIKMVQVNISAKAVSIVDSSLIAAKSDFTTVKSEYELLAELEAFDMTSQKLADFLLPSFHRYWEKGVQGSEEKVINAPPMPMADT